MLTDQINFCPQCGEAVVQAERMGRLRPVCPRCGWIYFPDPKVAVAVVVQQGEQILLVRRANDPLRGYWTLPAGFMDAGEDPRQAAERECQEETGLRVQAGELLDVLAGQEHSRGAHLLIVYRAEPDGKDIQGEELQAADDVDRAAFFPLNNLPPLAFKTTEKILALLAVDRP